MKKVIVVGSLNMDLCISAPYCPVGGETLEGENFFSNFGGKGSNQAIAAAKSAAKTVFCGCVGNDLYGSRIIENLNKCGVDTRFIRRAENVSTGIAVILITGGENRIILDKGANNCLTEADVDGVLSVAEEGDIYLTQLENPVPIIGYGLKRAKERGLYTILNPAPASKQIFSYLKYVDMITPNESELSLLGGAEAILREGVKILLVTLGSKGHAILSDKGQKNYPCIKVKAVDTTAAGDTFCGALSSCMLLGEDPEKAAEYASKAASIACTRFGASQSIPTREEVLNYNTANGKN